jgi:hypothetical protein
LVITLLIMPHPGGSNNAGSKVAELPGALRVDEEVFRLEVAVGYVVLVEVADGDSNLTDATDEVVGLPPTTLRGRRRGEGVRREVWDVWRGVALALLSP